MFTQCWICSPNVGLMSGQRRRRGPNIKPTPGCCLVLPEQVTHRTCDVNAYPAAKLISLNFQPLGVVSRYRDPQPEVFENYSYCLIWDQTFKIYDF